MLKVRNQHHFKIPPGNQISTISPRRSRFLVSPKQSKDLLSGDHVLDPGRASVPDSGQTVSRREKLNNGMGDEPVDLKSHPSS